ncbi:hypothetical protein KKE26_11935 [bacterium]|nr:hypothetical protein [bacterium]
MKPCFVPLCLCAFVCSYFFVVFSKRIMQQRLVILSMMLAFCIGCSQVESRSIFMAKKNASEYARNIPGVKKHKIIAVKTVKNFKEATKFLERNGVTSSIIEVNNGDIVLIVRLYYRLQWMGKNIVFVCDSRGKLKDMIERIRPERPYVRW